MTLEDDNRDVMLAQTLADQLAAFGPVTRLGIAVSGGGDSMAVLDVARDFCGSKGIHICAATVDHGLRAVSHEIALVERYCSSQEIDHDVLRWVHGGVEGNVQAKAREARYQLLRGWAERAKLDAVLLGHTQDDQCETILMGLARGSGIDGLCGMATVKEQLFVRPFLGVSRATLRAYLQGQGIAWVDDPSNEDPAFLRVRVRDMMPALQDLGLNAQRLEQMSMHMRRARVSLDTYAVTLAQRHVQLDHGDLLIDGDVFSQTNSDAHMRLVSSALQWMSGAPYRPRWSALQKACASVTSGQRHTVCGALMTPYKDQYGDIAVRVSRESNAVKPVQVEHLQAGQELLWDHRWVVSCRQDITQALTLQAIGCDVSQLEDWRNAGLPFSSAKSALAIYIKDHNNVLAVPTLGFCNGFSAKLKNDFHSWLLTH